MTLPPATPARRPATERLRRRLSDARLHTALIRLAAGLVLLAALVMLGEEVHGHVGSWSAWVASLGRRGMAVFVVATVVGTSLLLPASIFGLTAGALFGLGPGLLLSVMATLIAASVQYALARSLLRRRVQALLADRPGLRAIQTAVLADEIRLQALLRLTPLHAATTSYVLGAAGVRFGGFLLTTLCLLPHLLLEVYLGHAGAQATEVAAGGTVLEHAAMVAGLLASGLGLVVVSRAARNALLTAVDEAGPPG